MKETQEQKIQAILSKHNIQNEVLHRELLDHICAKVEAEYTGSMNLEYFIENELNDLAPQGITNLENQINFINNPNIFLMSKIVFLFGFISSLLLTAGFMFKMMSWPGANILLLTGFVTVFMLFIPYLGLKAMRQGDTTIQIKLRNVIGTVSAFLFGTSVIFKFMHLMGASVLFVISMVIFMFGFLPLLFISLYQNSIGSKKQTS